MIKRALDKTYNQNFNFYTGHSLLCFKLEL